ncbi:DNA-directed RNA polymerase I subunit [Trichoderma ceciliae]
MAPKEPYKVHSLNKHIEDTKKGLSASAQYNRRPVSKSSAAAVKKEPGIIDAGIFGNNDDSDESSDSSDSDSDEESSADFMKKLIPNGAKPSVAPKRRSRDEEIADSDVERNASAKRSAAIEKEKVMKKESSSSESSSDSSSESDSEQSEPKAKANGASANWAVAAKISSSSSSEEESSEEEESSDDEGIPETITKKSGAPVATNGAAKATAEADNSSSSSEEESSDDEAGSTEPEAAKKATEVSPSGSETSQSEDNDQVDESMHLSDREMDKRVAAPNFIAPDFTLRKGDDGANGQDVARICSEANLQGKQFWYFTVPSNVPISVIQNLEIPMDRSQLDDRVFSHEGQDYGVSFDTIAPRSSIQILIPSSNDSKYQPARQQIDQTMHIKRITSLGGAAASSVGPAPRRAPRPQPKGLRARYQPFGVNTPMGSIGADASEDADVEMGEVPEAAATAKPVKKDKKSKKDDANQSKSKDKKKGTDAVTVSATEVQPSKTDRKGKRKHTISEDDALAAAEQLREENDSVEARSKKQKTTRISSPDLGAELPSTSKKETPIAPPAIPSSAFSFSALPSSAPVLATPSKAAAATPSTAKKSTKKTKPETPIPTPRQTAVPLPNLPLTSRPKESPVPLPSSSTILATTPLQSKSKRGKKSKDEVNATLSSQQSPPPSAQGGDKKKPAIKANRLG